MKSSEMQYTYKAGYEGKPDVMRDRAKAIMDSEIKKAGVTKPNPKSFSAPEHTKMRNYKRGGPVKAADGGAMPPKVQSIRSMVPTMKKVGAMMKPMSRLSSNMNTANQDTAAPMKMAIGGSGKIRHKQMTKAGKQLNAKGKPC